MITKFISNKNFKEKTHGAVLLPFLFMKFILTFYIFFKDKSAGSRKARTMLYFCHQRR